VLVERATVPRAPGTIAASPACAAPAWSSAATARRDLDRPAGGDYRNFELKNSDDDDACKAACVGDNKSGPGPMRDRICSEKTRIVF